MPYITKEYRTQVDELVDQLVTLVRGNPELMKKVDGVANYIVTRIATGLHKPENGKWNYSSISDVVKTLECAKLEVYRRMGGEYEDLAKLNNGDIPEFYALDRQVLHDTHLRTIAAEERQRETRDSMESRWS